MRSLEDLIQARSVFGPAFWLATVCLIALVGCSDPPLVPADWKSKITFDFTNLDDSGLAGPADGKVSVDYEFCIPDDPVARSEIEEIDSSVNFSYSRGRIGRKEGEILCIGSTHQPNYREILQRLAERPYVSRIDQCFWE